MVVVVTANRRRPSATATVAATPVRPVLAPQIPANSSQSHGFNLVRTLNYGFPMMTRLDSISNRSKSTRLYLFVFSAMLGLATIVSVSSIGTVVTQHLASR